MENTWQPDFIQLQEHEEDKLLQLDYLSDYGEYEPFRPGNIELVVRTFEGSIYHYQKCGNRYYEHMINEPKMLRFNDIENIISRIKVLLK